MPQETLSEIYDKERARLEDAARYQSALGDVATAKVTMRAAQEEGARHVQNIARLDKARELVEQLDADVDVHYSTLGTTINGDARYFLLGIIAKAKAGEERRRDAQVQSLQAAKVKLAQAEQTLAEMG